MAELKRAERKILEFLFWHSGGQYMAGRSLPNGHGHVTDRGPSGVVLKGLRNAGLIEYGKEPQHSLYGWRITTAGRVALYGGPAPVQENTEAANG